MSVKEEENGLSVPDFGEHKNRTTALKSIRVAMKSMNSDATVFGALSAFQRNRELQKESS